MTTPMPEVAAKVTDEKLGLHICAQLMSRGAEWDHDVTGLYSGRAWRLTGILLNTPKALRLMADVIERPALPVEFDDDGGDECGTAELYD